MSVFQDILEVTSSAVQIVSDNVTVEVKTNYGPGIPIPTTSRSSEPGLLSRVIGLRAGLIIRNSRGEVIETIGDPAPTSPVRFVALLGFVGVGVFVVARGVLK